MSNSGENYELFYIFFPWHFKVMLIIPSCAKWLIWKLRNSNEKFIKLNFGFCFSKGLWTWIDVVLDVLNFTKDKVKDYHNNIIFMVKKLDDSNLLPKLKKTFTIKKIWNFLKV
jgi:hypothetical protein